MAVRLQKYLAMAGVASRRAGEQMIREGRVKVNGQTITEMGVTVDPAVDQVEVDNRLVKPVEKKEYILLYKPIGYVTTLKDPYGRQTVQDLVKDVGTRVFPVGRLDLDTSGLLLLTNDGELANRLTHPSFGVEKEYLARIHDLPDSEALTKLQKGVKLDDGYTAPAAVRLIKGGRPTSTLSLTIKEGRNRQVRRMLEAVNHPVVSLQRVRVGPLTLTGLKKGQWRRLNGAEVKALKRQAGVKS
ncbi:MAG TPA: pseudouridine synthase [Oscillospiraceae bacterium]|nr:pseudouridine synthase [Oscillospiraceae bacterium]